MQSLIFFGSDQYSAVALTALIGAQIDLQIEVITDRPKPVGKGQILTSSPVEILAKTHDLKVSYYPDFDHSLITKDALGLCASFDHLIPAAIIEKFGGNLYNLHPSLLPQYRNVSPVQYAIVMGDKETGITLFRISTGIDNGEMIAQATEPILETDTTPTLTPRLFAHGAKLFLQFIQGSVPCIPTKKNKVRNLVFTHRLTRDSGYIEWPVLHQLLAGKAISPTDTKNELLQLRLSHNPTGNILSDLLRALTPWPGVWSNVPTKKSDLRISLISNSGSLIPNILISGKPKAISYHDFTKYYLTAVN